MSTEYPFSYDNETIEHKTGIPLPVELARDIAAFANTKGGKIIIGYIPTVAGLINFKGLTDTQIRAAKASTEAALLLLHPKPFINVTEDNIDGDKKTFVVNVAIIDYRTEKVKYRSYCSLIVIFPSFNF